jgi:hypothetical protein
VGFALSFVLDFGTDLFDQCVRKIENSGRLRKSHTRRRTQNAPCHSTDWQNGKGAFVGKSDYLLIFVEDHSIDDHVVAFAHVMHVDRHTDFDSRSDGVFIEDFTALGHIRDCVAEAI